MKGLPLARACQLATGADPSSWLIEELWADQAVGVLGGEPKCCKSFLALDIAVSVASATPCLRRFPVRRTGPVLLFPAEDSHRSVRQRIEGICAAAHTSLDRLPLYVITSSRLLLDRAEDRCRLRHTVAELKPVLLVLDPFIRLHHGDENASKEVAPLLGFLRELQREFRLAVLLVHHVRKRSAGERPGQALRGSSDLHGWGDSNLYLRRSASGLRLSVEHRAAPSPQDIALELLTNGPALALSIPAAPPSSDPFAAPSAEQRILTAMRDANRPLSIHQLRHLCRIRTATLCDTLASLRRQGRVLHTRDGYQLSQVQPSPPVPLSPPSPVRTGNGNGKLLSHPDLRADHQLSRSAIHQIP